MTNFESFTDKLNRAGFEITGETDEDGRIICRPSEGEDAEYFYGMRLRGFSPACQPKEGFLWREDDENGDYYDVIVYNRRLSDAELRAFDLDFIAKVI